MPNLIDPQIKDVDPDRVYVFPNKLTVPDIEKNVAKLHTIANDEADRTIYCLFDEVKTNNEYEVCFPVTHLNLKKYDIDDFKVIQRCNVASCKFDGNFDNLLNTVTQLSDYATEQGYTTHKPYRFLFILSKKAKFSKQQEFSLEIQIPVS